jgi:hypothetical protein
LRGHPWPAEGVSALDPLPAGGRLGVGFGGVGEGGFGAAYPTRRCGRGLRRWGGLLVRLVGSWRRERGEQLPVAGRRPAPAQPELFQIIDGTDHRGLVAAERIEECPLAGRAAPVELEQHAEVPVLQAERAQGIREARLARRYGDAGALGRAALGRHALGTGPDSVEVAALLAEAAAGLLLADALDAGLSGRVPLARRPEQAGRFFGVLTGAVPVAEFFSPGNLRRLVGLRTLLPALLRRPG